MSWIYLESISIDIAPLIVYIPGWGNPLKSTELTFTPIEDYVPGWGDPLESIQLDITPSEEIYAGWNGLRTVQITIGPSGADCLIDSDCHEGYKCENGKCVLINGNGDGEFPWIVVGVASAAVAGIALVATRKGKKPQKKRKAMRSS